MFKEGFHNRGCSFLARLGMRTLTPKRNKIQRHDGQMLARKEASHIPTPRTHMPWLHKKGIRSRTSAAFNCFNSMVICKVFIGIARHQCKWMQIPHEYECQQKMLQDLLKVSGMGCVRCNEGNLIPFFHIKLQQGQTHDNLIHPDNSVKVPAMQ